MTAVLWMWLLASGNAETCPDPERLVRRAEQDIELYYLADAANALDDAQEALACGGLAEPTLLARMWLAEGVLLALEGDDPTEPFRSAARLDPDLWVDSYGSALFATYQEAVEEPKQVDPVAIDLRGLGEDEQIAVDGSPARLPLELRPGTYFMQVGVLPDVRAARVVRVPEGASMHVRFPPPDAPPEPSPPGDVHATPSPRVDLQGRALAGVATNTRGRLGPALALRFETVERARLDLRAIHGRAPSRPLEARLREVAESQEAGPDVEGIGWSTGDLELGVGWQLGALPHQPGPWLRGDLQATHHRWLGGESLLENLGVVPELTRTARLGPGLSGGTSLSVEPLWLMVGGGVQLLRPLSAGGGMLGTDQATLVLEGSAEPLRPAHLVPPVSRAFLQVDAEWGQVEARTELGLHHQARSRRDRLEDGDTAAFLPHTAFLVGYAW